MSRIGKKPIQIPAGVEVKIDRESSMVQRVTASGQKGEISQKLPKEVRAEIKDGQLFVFPQLESKKTKALRGLTRALIFNMISGVKDGYEKKLEISGVGYGAKLNGDELELKVGYINTIKIKVPLGIKFSVEKNIITISGFDKEKVGQVAATIRKTKPVEPYKGKGIKYLGEQVRRKVGKRVTATAGGAAA